MALLPIVARCMTESPVRKAIVDPRLGSVSRALQMKLTDQPAVVAGVGDQPGDHRGKRRKGVVAVARVVDPRRVHAGHEARSARRANRTLAISVREGDALAHQ